MIICSMCGAQNEDTNSFCVECGNPIKNGDVKENVIKTEVATVNNNGNKKPRNRKKILTIVSVLTVIACIVGFSSVWAYGYMLKKNPVKWVAKGMDKYTSANTLYSTSKTKVSIDATSSKDRGAIMASKLIEGMSIQSKTKLNKKTKEASYDVALNFNNQPILNGKIYVNDKDIVISIPSLYSKNLYLNINDLNDLANKNSKGSIDVEKYKSLLDFSKAKDFKEVKKTYSEFAYDNINPLFKRQGEAVLNIETESGKKDTVKCEQLAFNMNMDQASDLLNKILLKIADDKNVKNLLKDKLNEFFAIVDKNNDYEKFDLTKEEVSEIKDAFDKKYDEGMKEMKTGLSNIEKTNKNGVDFSITSDIFMDSKNRVRGFNNEIKVKVNQVGSVKIINENVINSIDERVNIEKLSTKDGVNLSKADEAQLQEIMEEIQENAAKVLSKQFGF